MTHALTRPETALAAVEALRGVDQPAVVEALVERIHLSDQARVVVAAIDALAPGRPRSPAVEGAFLFALDSPYASVRNAAARELASTERSDAVARLARLIREDGSWTVRRSALSSVAAAAPPFRWAVLAAADDPHWRVRHALVRVLTGWGSTGAGRVEIRRRLAETPGPRSRGVSDYLTWLWDRVPPGEFPEPEDPPSWCPFWDWDFAVLARNVELMSEAERRATVAFMPSLLDHPDERVREQAVSVLREYGKAEHLAAALERLREPRRDGERTVRALLERIDQDRIDEIPEGSLRIPKPSRAGPVPITSMDSSIRRAAELTPERAGELVADPEKESSWHVLARAARLTRTPLWELEPAEPWRPPPTKPARETIPLPARRPTATRPLGPRRWPVAPLGLSGHYGLPVEGFVRAVESGVDLMFWEPNYQSMTRFFGRLAPQDRRRIRLVAGTFEADGRRVKLDAERVLRLLGRDTIDVFLLFWVRGWDRVRPDVREALDALKASGKVLEYGLSTHDRRLAVEALAEGWNPVMVRHSAAHRGAEEVIFPKAVELGIGLIAFNVTCYGRLLLPHGDAEPPRPSDCYRYTLSRPGVSACWSAPATLEQLDENLTALTDPELPPDRLGRLIRHADDVYREDTIFRRLIRAL